MSGSPINFLLKKYAKALEVSVASVNSDFVRLITALCLMNKMSFGI
jgi:hypothetical protein